MCVSLSLYYDVKFGGSHYVMHFLVLISYRYINYMCAFKLPVDQEYAIRQSFAAFLLLTPLFFPKFLGSNDKGNGGEWRPGLKSGEGTLSPPQLATGPCRPWGGRQGPVARWGWGGATGPLFFFCRDFVANLKKKNTFEPCRPPIGRPGYIFEIFQNGHIFLKFYFF